VAGQEILETVPCDDALPDVLANVIRSYQSGNKAKEHEAFDPLFTAAATAGLASWHSLGALTQAAGAP
jgi:hypothetical protein